MSTMNNPVDSALNFLPEASAGRAVSHGGRFASVAAFFVTISNGMAAMHRYETLRARGVAPSDAAARVHAEFYSR